MLSKVKCFWRKAQERGRVFWRWLIGIAVDLTRLIAFYKAIQPYMPRIIQWLVWLFLLLFPESVDPPQ